MKSAGSNELTLERGVLSEFIDWAYGFSNQDGWVFRGQPDATDALVPGIARDDPKVDPRGAEQKLLDDLRLRLPGVYDKGIKNDWELLALAQHHGAPTRFLDWTRSSLAALWFAVAERKRSVSRPDCAVWACLSKSSDFVSENEAGTAHPFDIKKTRFYQPNYFDRRLSAQQGLFSVHKYWESGGRVVALESNKSFSARIRKLKIPAKFRLSLLKELNSVGVNAAALFPDLDGICFHSAVTHNLSPRMVFLGT